LAEEQKKVSTLLDVARQLSVRHISYHLTFIGDGPSRPICESAAQESLLQGRITILSGASWTVLTSHLLNNHVAVLTSDYEGFCFSLAEALGSGLPAVAFQCGKVIEQFVVHGKTGLLAAPADIDGFVSYIAQIQANPVLWSNLSSNARSLISNEFSWQSAGKKYMQLFEQALADPMPRRWTFGRPAWISTEGRTLSSIVERIGKTINLWQ
jgi:glycosyltransferase involved in cell wall biosynthesis